MIRLYRFLKPYTLPIIGVLVLVLFQAMSDLYLPTLMADIVDTGIVKGDTTYIWHTGGWMLLVTIGGVICAIIASLLSSQVSIGFGQLIRGKIFSHVERFSLHEFDKISTASMITRTTNDTTQVQNVTLIIMRMMIYAPMIAIGGIFMALRQDVPLSLVIIVSIPVIVVSILLVTGKAIPLFNIIQKKIDVLNLILDENLTGMRVIRAFDRSEHETQRFDIANLDLTDTSLKANRIIALLMPIMMLVMNFSTIAIIWFGSIRINDGNMEVGALIAFLQYAMQIMFAMVMMSMMFVMLPRAAASATRINEILDIVPEINDPAQAAAPATEHGYVEFQDVTFSYPGAEQPALEHITFEAGPGEVTAIIGGTGAGKSTLVNLIPRFYDIDSGHVLVDGIDVREMKQEDLRMKIGYVPQQAILFSGSISDNIHYGDEDASIEGVEHAAMVAQANEFISGMKEGFDSQISQGGTNVSGGQKQRLSIARALVRKPEIYIFDDSFSALDFKTDAQLRAALKSETTTATVFIVAQRVSTVMDADRIIVLDDGNVAGIGNHHELMATCEVYREIVSSQLSAEEIA
jgi:ABC-type multidrug transport system, ATPase and permease components